jgi:hypothetical protein
LKGCLAPVPPACCWRRLLATGGAASLQVGVGVVLGDGHDDVVEATDATTVGNLCVPSARNGGTVLIHGLPSPPCAPDASRRTASPPTGSGSISTPTHTPA